MLWGIKNGNTKSEISFLIVDQWIPDSNGKKVNSLLRPLFCREPLVLWNLIMLVQGTTENHKLLTDFINKTRQLCLDALWTDTPAALLLYFWQSSCLMSVLPVLNHTQFPPTHVTRWTDIHWMVHCAKCWCLMWSQSGFTVSFVHNLVLVTCLLANSFCQRLPVLILCSMDYCLYFIWLVNICLDLLFLWWSQNKNLIVIKLINSQSQFITTN